MDNYKNWVKIKHVWLLTIFLMILALYLIKVTNFKLSKEANAPAIQEKWADIIVSTVQEKQTKTSLDQLLWQKINHLRIEQNLKPYFADESLCQFANQRLDSMDSRQLSHANFWPEAVEFFPENNFISLAENLSSFQLMQTEQLNSKIVADKILQSWLQSEKHIQNLTADFTHSCLICKNQICIQVFASY